MSSIVEHLQNRAVSNRMLLSMASANFRRARQRGELGARWLGLMVWQSAKITLFPWNWIGGGL